ncbi:MAG: FkbM family methyltransferase [Fibrobacterota bacterium]
MLSIIPLSWKRVILSVLEPLCNRLWKLFPLRVKATILSDASRSTTGRLDYKGGNIRLSIDSLTSFYRLSSCGKEPGTIAWIEKYVKAGDVFYDIGANIGAYALVAATKFKPNIQVYAFEPSFSSFAALCRNIQLNGLGNYIIAVNIPLSSATGRSEFQYSDLESGSACHPGLTGSSSTQTSGSATFTQVVFTQSIDILVRNFAFKSPNHIKLDVDGHELQILKGAQNVLKSGAVRTIQVEIEEKTEYGKEIMRFLTELGYRVVEHNIHANPAVVDYVFEKS